jgi:DinB family protein
MADPQTVLESHHQAIEAFLATARAVPSTQWSRPRAPGKWSPGQVAEHLALSYEVNRGVLHGDTPPMTAPRWLRPLIRRFLLGPVLRRGRFIPGSKSPRAFRPGPTPAPPAQLLDRLAAAMTGFEADAAALGTTAIDHPFFGRLPLSDFVKLQVIHTQHHRGQLPPAAV